MARRGDIPPYEIMRQRGKAAAAPEPVDQEQPGPASTEKTRWIPEGLFEGGPADWLASLKGAWAVPIALRVPRGLAVVVLVGLLLLMALAYWVGSARGRGAAEAAYEARLDAGAGVPGPRGMGGISISTQQEPPASAGAGGSGGAADPGGGPRVEPTYDDPRERGLNYFRLVATSPEEGREIAQFMAQARIDTHLYLVDNSGLCIVYAVERGFRSDELNSDARRQHESHLRALGNQWRELGSGHSNFATMIPERYDGPDAD